MRPSAKFLRECGIVAVYHVRQTRVKWYNWEEYLPSIKYSKEYVKQLDLIYPLRGDALQMRMHIVKSVS